jgi:hypothetical protein
LSFSVHHNLQYRPNSLEVSVFSSTKTCHSRPT